MLLIIQPYRYLRSPNAGGLWGALSSRAHSVIRSVRISRPVFGYCEVGSTQEDSNRLPAQVRTGQIRSDVASARGPKDPTEIGGRTQ
jgi:hypothetical protein